MKIICLIILTLLLFSFASSADYQLKKSSELQIGDVIIDSEGNEIIVEKIAGSGRVQEKFVYEKSESLMDVLWGKVAGKNLPEHIVSGGNSEKGLSLGETGVGVKVFEGEISLPNDSVNKVETRSSFLSKIFFWRNK
jgi:hypothetical protein